MNNFEICDDENGIGKVLILKGAWSDDYARYMQEHGILALRYLIHSGSKGMIFHFFQS